MARYPRTFGSAAARAQSRAAFAAIGGFLPVDGAALAQAIESNVVTLANFVGTPSLTITGGQYSKNGAAYSTAATTVTNGDTLRLRVTSAANAGTAVSAVATIDGQPRTFTVTTAASSGISLHIAGTPAAAAVGGGDTFTPAITGGTAPYSLSLVSGTLPPGRTVNGGARTVTGTYTAPGSYSYTLRATDAAGVTSDLPVNVTVTAAAGNTVAIPSGFPLATLPFAISRSGSGQASTFTTDYAHAAKRPAAASTIHVSAAGNADGTGAPADPVPSVSMAIAMGNATGQPYTIAIAAGRYNVLTIYSRTAAPAGTYVASWTNATPTQDVAVIGIGTVILSHAFPQQTFTATADPNIFFRTLTADGGRWVADLSKLDDTGLPVGLDQVTTVADATAPFAEINALWTPERGASWYQTGSARIWVRLPDNRVPDANVLVFRGQAAGAGVITAPSSARTIWLDNVQFWGGPQAFTSKAAPTGPVNVYSRDCKFAFAGSHSGGGLGAFGHVDGPGEIIHQRAVACYSYLDGFNYHGVSQSSTAAQCPTIYEIDCKSRSTGWSGGNANNGTTTHEACVSVRVNGDHRGAADRTVHDVNRTRSWLLGSFAATRRGQDGTRESSAFAVGHPSDGATCQMWIDACTVGGSPQNPFEAYPGSTLFHANMAVTPTTDLGGTITTYTAG